MSKVRRIQTIQRDQVLKRKFVNGVAVDTDSNKDDFTL